MGVAAYREGLKTKSGRMSDANFLVQARGHTDLVYSDKTWSKKEQQVFWNKSPLARMLGWSTYPTLGGQY